MMRDIPVKGYENASILMSIASHKRNLTDSFENFALPDLPLPRHYGALDALDALGASQFWKRGRGIP